MSKGRNTLELMHATISHIQASEEKTLVKSDFHLLLANIDPDTAEELWKIAKLGQDRIAVKKRSSRSRERSF